MLDFSSHNSIFAPCDDLKKLLSDLIKCQSGIHVLSFKSPTPYSEVLGGFRPVDIGISVYEGKAKLLYLTDFCYFSGELVKGVDFSFEHNVFNVGYGDLLMNDECKDFWNIYSRNFLTYVQIGSLELNSHNTY